MTFIVGLTGGIGSGKSAAAQVFGDLAIVVIDTDAIARALMSPVMRASRNSRSAR